MAEYLVKRILVMMATLLAISFITFVIIQLPPGDYLSNQIAELKATGDTANLAKLEFLRNEYSLDKPMIQQYGIWLGVWPGSNGAIDGILQGNFGYSFEYELPVSDVVGDRLFLTFLVSFFTIIFTWAVAFPIGAYGAVRQYSIADHGLTLIGYIGLATPNFLLALVLVYLANRYFDTEISGLMDSEFKGEPWSWAKFMSVLEHIWIPVVVIGTSGTAGMIRRLRANLLDELQKQYVTTARAKGLGNFRLIMKYPLRMALNPFIADIGSLLPELISGAAIVSAILQLETTGPMLLEALQNQDQYLAGSFLMFLAFLTVVGMFLSDLALMALDPRIRMGGGAQK